MNNNLNLSYKCTDKYEIIDMDDNTILMPVKSNNKAIILNKTAKILLIKLQNTLKLEDLINIIVSNFNVSIERASIDVKKFIDSMIKLSVIYIVK